MGAEKLGTKLFLPELAREKRETLQWINEGRLQRPVQVVWGFDDRTAVIDRGIELFRMFAAHERRALFHVINQSGTFPVPRASRSASTRCCAAGSSRWHDGLHPRRRAGHHALCERPAHLGSSARPLTRREDVGLEA